MQSQANKLVACGVLAMVGVAITALYLNRVEKQPETNDNSGVSPQPSVPSEDQLPPVPDAVAELKRRTDEHIASYISSLSPKSSEYFHSDYVTYVTLERPDISGVDGERLFFQDKAYLIDFLLQHSEMTSAYDGLEIEPMDVRKSGEIYAVRYRQKLDEALVNSISIIKFRITGEVESLRSYIIQPNAIGAGATVQRDEAISHAKYALGVELGHDQIDAIVMPLPGVTSNAQPPTLYVRMEEIDKPAVLFWKISLVPAGGGASYTAWVDASSGETAISSNIVR